MAKKAEIEKLLAHSQFNHPTFVFAVVIDFSQVRGASLANVAGASQENVAFKLHDFGFRRQQ